MASNLAHLLVLSINRVFFIANFYWKFRSIASKFILYVDVRFSCPSMLMRMNELINRIWNRPLHPHQFHSHLIQRYEIGQQQEGKPIYEKTKARSSGKSPFSRISSRIGWQVERAVSLQYSRCKRTLVRRLAWGKIGRWKRNSRLKNP